jgi:predicted phosphodiesterase
MNLDTVKNLTEDYASKYKGRGLSSTQITQELFKDHPEITETFQHVTLMIYECLSREVDPKTPGEKPIEIAKEAGDKYEVVDDHYIWSSKKAGNIKISVEDADKMFYEYSRLGLDLSQEQVRQKHNFSIPQWNSIKNTLWLYKQSNIFSPYTAENTQLTDLQEMISSKFDMKFNDKNRLIEDEYRKHTLKEYKKVVKNSQMDRFASTEFIHELNSLLPANETVTVNKFSTKSGDPVDIFAVIADLHIGGKTEGLTHTPDFNLEVLEQRLADVASGINNMKAKRVTLGILGDIIESFTGLNHINSWQSMEFGVYGAKVVFTAYTALSKFFDQINNLSAIKIIGGNHDRSTESSKVDRKSTIAEIIFYMLKEKYGTIYNIEFNPLVLTHDMTYTKFILAHGDKNVVKKAGSSIDAKVIEYGDVNKFNVVLTGHLHSRGINEDKKHYRWYRCPSIFSGNYYSEENGWNARPGYFIVTENEIAKLPTIHDIPLK